MKSKILTCVTFFTLILFSFTACQSNSASPDPSAPQTPAAENGVSLSVEEAYTNFDKNDSEAGTAVAVALADNATTVSGAGVTVDKNTVTVTAGGTYRVSGTLSNGQLRVNVAKTDKVRLILDGVNITCQNGAPLYILSADKTAITLAAGTENRLADGSFYALNSNGEPNACVFSKDDLTINGTGGLTVVSVYNNGIASKNDLKIVSGRVTVEAPNNGLKGKDSVCILDGTISVKAEDAIKSDNDLEAGRGYIRIDGGTLTLNATDDGLQAITAVAINGGKVAITAKGDEINCDATVNVKEGCLVN